MTSALAKKGFIIAVLSITFLSPSFGIWGGLQVRPSAYPAAVQIFLGKTSKGRFTEKCSGVVLEQRWILTAAHCFRKFRSLPRSLHLSQGVDRGEHKLDVKKIRLHKRFDKAYSQKPDVKSLSLSFDLALIEFDQDLSQTFGNSIRPITVENILTQSELVKATQSSGKFVLAAFGQYKREEKSQENHVLRKMDVSVRLGTRPEIRTQSIDIGKHCNSDSGGGVIWVDGNGTQWLVGVLSASNVKNGCDVAPSVGFVAPASNVIPWLQELGKN